MSVRIPAHLPDKLTITMWDFSWYTMTMPGEPYDDLGARFAEAVERGYNTIRICAMPYFLFTADGKREGTARFLEFGRRYRTKNPLVQLPRRSGAGRACTSLQAVRGSEEARLLYYFVILGISAKPVIFDAALNCSMNCWRSPPKERFMAIARSMSRLIDLSRKRDMAIASPIRNCITKSNTGDWHRWRSMPASRTASHPS